ncbi:hypothetical protein AGMMS50276_08450 [Synergistales bacterium]|nr:hypothetical protein AGMMS50276_08450 [Synergistales bacterium]
MSSHEEWSWSLSSVVAYLQRQAAREQRHREYLQRQANREKNHQEYLQRQAAREQRQQEYLQRQAVREKNQREYLARQERQHQEFLAKQAAREANEQEYIERIQENVSHFRERYEKTIETMRRDGLEDYMPAEFTSLRERMAELDDLLDHDPKSARELSLSIGEEISRVSALSRAARTEFEAKERARLREFEEKRAQAKSELSQFLYSSIAEIQDPIAQDFAFDELRVIQADYSGRAVDQNTIAQVKNELKRKIDAVMSRASERAEEWKRKKAEENAPRIQEVLIQAYQEELKEDGEKNEEVQSILKGLEALRNQASSGARPVGDLRSSLKDIVEKTDVAVADESCRRMVVRSVYDALKKLGFILEAPRLESGEKDEVVILARKPSGSEAKFRISPDGKMNFRFDKYEGMMCKNDIDKVLLMLDDIYGIKLSDERVLWQNPDRIDKTQKPIPGDNYRRSGTGNG